MPTFPAAPSLSWDQKRAQIAAALQGALQGGGGGSTLPGLGGALQSIGNGIGAGWRANPMMRWGQQGAAAPEMAGGQGLMGATPTQGQMMAQANASLQGAPGFDYVPPSVGPAPVPAAAANPNAKTPEEVAELFLAQDPNRMSYQQRRGLNIGFGGQSDHGGYSTSGRDSRGRSSGWGGAQRGSGGLY